MRRAEMIGFFLLGSVALVVVRSRFSSLFAGRTVSSQAVTGLVPGLLAAGVVLSSSVDLVPDQLESGFFVATILLAAIVVAVATGRWMRVSKSRNHPAQRRLTELPRVPPHPL